MFSHCYCCIDICYYFLSAHDTKFFLLKYLAYQMYKPIPIKGKYQKA